MGAQIDLGLTCSRPRPPTQLCGWPTYLIHNATASLRRPTSSSHHPSFSPRTSATGSSSVGGKREDPDFSSTGRRRAASRKWCPFMVCPTSERATRSPSSPSSSTRTRTSRTTVTPRSPSRAARSPPGCAPWPHPHARHLRDARPLLPRMGRLGCPPHAHLDAGIDLTGWHNAFPNISMLSIRLDSLDRISCLNSLSIHPHLLPALQMICSCGVHKERAVEDLVCKARHLDITLYFEPEKPFHIPLFLGDVSH